MTTRHDDPEDHMPKRSNFELSKTQIFLLASVLGLIGPSIAGYVTYRVFQGNVELRMASAEEQVEKVPRIEINVAEMKKDINYLAIEQKNQAESMIDIRNEQKDQSKLLNQIYIEVKKP